MRKPYDPSQKATAVAKEGDDKWSDGYEDAKIEDEKENKQEEGKKTKMFSICTFRLQLEELVEVCKSVK